MIFFCIFYPVPEGSGHSWSIETEIFVNSFSMRGVINISTTTPKAHLGSDNNNIFFCFMNLVSFFLMIEQFLQHFVEQTHV